MNNISLKEYLDSRLESIEKSIQVANAELNRRLEGMNEFREQLKEQAGSFIARTEYAVCIEKLNTEIKILREYKASLEGKASQTSVILAIIISIIGIVLGITNIIFAFIK